MKTAIHPQYFPEAQVKCANCNNVLTIGATHQEIRVEICSKCHPFYTGGKNVILDIEGRVDKFKQKMSAAADKPKKKKVRKTLEEKVNEQIAVQLQKDKDKEAKAAEKKAAKKAKAE
jgi:large subunit ribosomal protein L31